MTAGYHINVFWSTEDDSWVADIPDLAYCSAFGDTPQEALAEVLQAKEAWLESARSHGGPRAPAPLPARHLRRRVGRRGAK